MSRSVPTDSLPTDPGRAGARAAITLVLERTRSGDVDPAPDQTPQADHRAVAAVLTCVTDVLTEAATRDDAGLAQVCRGILDALRHRPTATDLQPAAGGAGEAVLCRGGGRPLGGVTDVRIDGRWIRTQPTVQLEGGNYSLDGARLLGAILDGFLARIDQEELSTAS